VRTSRARLMGFALSLVLVAGIQGVRSAPASAAASPAPAAPACINCTITFTVNSTTDGADANVGDGICADGTGHCTLRAAIQEANVSTIAHVGITFAIPLVCRPACPTPVLQPTSALPAVSHSQTVLDATSQPAVHAIVLDGAALVGAAGIWLSGGLSSVRGFLIRHCSPGIYLSGPGSNVVVGNVIGSPAGGKNIVGVLVYSPNNIIGGSASGTRNVISGNDADGVEILGGSGNQVIGNFIGTDVAGMAAAGNGGSGVSLLNASSNIVGGTVPGAGNVISGNGGDGVAIAGNPRASGNVIAGNFIGTNAQGTAGLPNAKNGITLYKADATIIGGTVAGARNVIAANRTSNIEIDGPIPGSPNQVLGNYIGTNAAGTGSPGLTPNGIAIVGAPNTVVGGASSGSGNLISGSTAVGVKVLDSPGTQIAGNRIGTNAAANAPIQNLNGVVLSGNNALVGGTSAGSGNVISGNDTGVLINRGTGNRVLGNLIGSDASGMNAVPNNWAGVALQDVSGNSVGGTAAGSRNVISGNSTTGVDIQQVSLATQHNVVQGNYIGVNAAGTASLPNGVNDASGPTGTGVVLGPKTALNTVGGTSAAARNVISGNLATGIRVDGNQNQVSGNFIGTNAAGTAAVPNGFNGVLLTTQFGGIPRGNTIGGAGVGSRNVISGNGPPSPYNPSPAGVLIVGGVPSNNVVAGNFIGTNAAGTAAIPNANGVWIDGSRNTVGGTGAGTGNLISGNSQSGVLIYKITSTASPTQNLVQGNLIGLRSDGKAKLGNGQNGVRIFQAPSNLIGGVTAGARNVISGNGRGILVGDKTSTGTMIQGNLIGTDPTGAAALGNAGAGIRIENALSTVVGGMAAGARNLISGNGAQGIDLESASQTTIQANFIGTNAAGTAALGNGADGIFVNGGTNNGVGGTTAGGANRIGFNRAAGVFVAAGVRDTILHNALFSNALLGIDLAPRGVNPNDLKDPDTGANLRQNYPVLNSATAAAATTTVTGTLNSTPNTAFTVELFVSPACDPSGFGEGQSFLAALASLSTDANGNATFIVGVSGAIAKGSFVTATATDPNGNTSEFAHCVTST
jgi:CSLREA domain-containing protein